MEVVRKTMEPITSKDGVALHVEYLQGLWDYQAWLHPLEMSLSGITITYHGESVNHMFRFILRKDLGNYRVHQQEFAWCVDTCEDV